jgi:hypothetical protein
MIRRKRGVSGSSGRVATIVALGVIGLLWLRLLVVQPRADQSYAPINSRQARLAREKRSELTGALGRLADAARKGEARSTVLRLSSADLNAILTAQPEVQDALAEARVRDFQVRIETGRVITSATVEKAGVPILVTAEGQLGAREGMLLYASDSVRVHGLPAPAPIRRAVDGRIQEAFRQLEEKAGARVDRVTVGRDRIALHLSSAPD